MKLKFLSLTLGLFVATVTFAQKSLNAYKYVIVPSKYEFLNEADQYQLNSLTEFLFEKYGFTAVTEGAGDYPQDLAENRCLGLKSNLEKNSSLFKTKLTVVLKNCSDQVVFTSQEGTSREKEYKTAYNLALRDAFKSIETLNYKYESKSVAAPVPLTPAVKAAPQVATVAAVPLVAASSNVEVPETGNGILYAQKIENGYQLVDSTPKVVYKLQKTNARDMFLVQGKSATVYKKGDEWVLEYYENDVLKQQVLNIKF
ncbi:hypothetical protein Q4566_11700 [Tamlana sp. 2_MG-2023]|uniref:hypothetical protein n=1 Tax=unclassified Tamlana TaxID=2614803 RepID=UPI0026E41B80|nr:MULTISPECIES: hypothetical protein [unclassified Tamlana]MDO6760867.1 hypothetical protein [Tamlana sp. 2_MG-2023]MDO6791123.1 hypothetical protein [Tamlana sp. 1_MG-2023]